MEVATQRSEDEAKLRIAEEASADLASLVTRLTEERDALMMESDAQAERYEAEESDLTQSNDALRETVAALPCAVSRLRRQLDALRGLAAILDSRPYETRLEGSLVDLGVLNKRESLTDLPHKLRNLVSRFEADSQTTSEEYQEELARVRHKYNLLCQTARRESFAAGTQSADMKDEIERLKRRLERLERGHSISFDTLSNVVSGAGGDVQRLTKSSAGFEYRGVSFIVDRKDGRMFVVEQDEGVPVESFIRSIDERSSPRAIHG
jgi:hypothetical protein